MIRIAISAGDPRGIGPEVVVKALVEPPDGASYLVFAQAAQLAALARRLGLRLARSVTVRDVANAKPCVSMSDAQLAGVAQLEMLQRATAAVLEGEADALCTAPISKCAIGKAGFAFPGHTEYLAHVATAKRHAMMLAGPQLRVVPLTGHVPLRNVAQLLNPEFVASRLELVAQALRDDFEVQRPRIALTGLNPHAGEEGAIGDEESLRLKPALKLLAESAGFGPDGPLIDGPLPADGLFAELSRGRRYDAVVCCYHDQALIPFKMRHPDDGVNVTLGLPFVRTSPAHGTAFDIAGRGIARCDSFRAALRMAVQICQRRKRLS